MKNIEFYLVLKKVTIRKKISGVESFKRRKILKQKNL
jgi:hypothetical protein